MTVVSHNCTIDQQTNIFVLQHAYKQQNMKIATKKFISSRPTQAELSPARKPRFQRTQKCQSTAERLHSRSTGQLNINSLNSNLLNINVKFVSPVIHNGQTSSSPLKHTEQEAKLGLLIKARINKYKRQTTPLKNEANSKERDEKSYLEKMISQNKQLQQIIDNKQLQIAELEHQNQKLSKITLSISQINAEKDKLTKLCFDLRRESDQKQQKIFLLESSFRENQNFLLQTKDSLEKLRKQMQQNRMMEMQKQKELLIEKIAILESRVSLEHQQVMKMDVARTKLEKDNEILNLTNQKLERQLFARSNVIEALKQESLNKQISSLKEQINSSKTQKEQYLEDVIIKQRGQITELKQTNKILYIKIDLLLKKIQYEQRSNKKNKSKQLTQLQGKFRKFLLEYKKFRREHNEVLQRNLHVGRNQKRDLLGVDDDQLSFSYSLSPERSQF